MYIALYSVYQARLLTVQLLQYVVQLETAGSRGVARLSTGS
jgi:hypothetical protein